MIELNSAIEGFTIVLNSWQIQMYTTVAMLLGYGVIFWKDPPKFPDHPE